MSMRTQWLGLGALLAVTLAGFAMLYNLGINKGDGFPRYSSLRADPLGTRGLHDSLAALPGFQVTRRYEPLNDLTVWPPRTIILAGSVPERLGKSDERDFAAIDRVVRNGSRVIIALSAANERASEKSVDDENKPSEKSDGEKNKADKAERETTETKPRAEKKIAPRVDLFALWALGLERREMADDAVRDPAAPEELPTQLRWGSETYFRLAADSPWRVLYRRSGEPVLVERDLGRGSLVLVADAFVLSNEALQRDRAPALLAWLIGAHAVVEFDENHLGVVRNKGVAALARKYGLGGAFIALLAAAGLFIWHRMALFVPPAPEREEVALTYNQTAGLEALLRRALGPADLAAASVAEWRRTASPADVARVEAALLTVPAGASPLSIYNTVVRALRRR